MKKITLILFGVFATLTLAAQPPMRPQGQRPLPNQFRDLMDHQQRMEIQRPQIEKKDGKVIITMTEEQFIRMRRIRKTQRFNHARFQKQSCCERCEMEQRRPHRGPYHGGQPFQSKPFR